MNNTVIITHHLWIAALSMALAHAGMINTSPNATAPGVISHTNSVSVRTDSFRAYLQRMPEEHTIVEHNDTYILKTKDGIQVSSALLDALEHDSAYCNLHNAKRRALHRMFVSYASHKYAITHLSHAARSLYRYGLCCFAAIPFGAVVTGSLAALAWYVDAAPLHAPCAFVSLFSGVCSTIATVTGAALTGVARATGYTHTIDEHAHALCEVAKEDCQYTPELFDLFERLYRPHDICGVSPARHAYETVYTLCHGAPSDECHHV